MCDSYFSLLLEIISSFIEAKDVLSDGYLSVNNGSASGDVLQEINSLVDVINLVLGAVASHLVVDDAFLVIALEQFSVAVAKKSIDNLAGSAVSFDGEKTVVFPEKFLQVTKRSTYNTDDDVNIKVSCMQTRETCWNFE